MKIYTIIFVLAIVLFFQQAEACRKHFRSETKQKQKKSFERGMERLLSMANLYIGADNFPVAMESFLGQAVRNNGEQGMVSFLVFKVGSRILTLYWAKGYGHHKMWHHHVLDYFERPKLLTCGTVVFANKEAGKFSFLGFTNSVLLVESAIESKTALSMALKLVRQWIEATPFIDIAGEVSASWKRYSKGPEALILQEEDVPFSRLKRKIESL